jgi:hypothetical protein
VSGGLAQHAAHRRVGLLDLGVGASTGTAKRIKLMNLFTAEEVAKVRKKGHQIRAAYVPPNKG